MKINTKIRPMTYDRVFKSVLQDRKVRNYLIDMLSNITKIPKAEFKGKIVFKNSELSNIENKEKLKIADLIIELDNSVINLEMNKKLYLGLIDKNDRYLYKIREGMVYQGQKEINFKRIIQINFDYYKLFDDRMIIKFEMIDRKRGLVRSDYVDASNIEIYHVNLKKVEEMYYNKEKLTKLEKELVVMTLDNEKDLKNVTNGDKDLEKVAEKIVTLSREEELAGIYIKEEQDEWIRDRYKEEGLKIGRAEGLKLGIEEGRKKGLEQGLEKGIEKGIKKTAINLLKSNIDISIISSATGLSIEEIKKLK